LTQVHETNVLSTQRINRAQAAQRPRALSRQYRHLQFVWFMAFLSADEAIGTTRASVNLTAGYLDDKISGLSA
jgi:hypothetical protein